MKTGRYRVVVVGCGKVGVTYEAERNRPKPASHAGVATHGKDTELVALVDSNPRALARAGKLFPHAARYATLVECLKREKPDIVVVATPAVARVALMRACANAGIRAVVCEKPMAASVREAREIKRIVEKSNTLFVLNYQRRFSPLVARLRAKVRHVQQVTCYYSNGLYNNGGHALDLLLYLLGTLDVEWARVNPRAVHPAGDSCIDAVLTTKSGARIVLQSLDQRAYGIFDIRILDTKGEKALIEYSDTLVETPVRVLQYEGERNLNRASARVRHGSPTSAIAEAVRCLTTRGKPRSSVVNGLAVMELLEDIQSCAKK